jgi:hypothetical protein
MGLLSLMIAGIVHFGLVLLDIILAFLVVRLLRRRLSWPLLETFDRIGSPLVSQVNDAVGQRLENLVGKSLSEVQLTAASMLFLVAVLGAPHCLDRKWGFLRESHPPTVAGT